MKQATTQFDFAAQPKVTALKAKYRQRQEDRLDGTNLMNDPRIVRGNTYAAVIANKNQIQPPPLKKTFKQTKKKVQPKQRRINFDTGFEPTTPRAISGRQHFTTQTQPFVQTLRDKPIQYQKQSQTDLFLDRPVQRLFNPMAQKTGIDRVTQVDQNDPELFNFDYQVQPILQALLAKVIQTSRMELFEQGQMEEKQRQKIQYEKRRHTQLAQAQKLQANQNRLRQQYERRQLQYRKSKQQQVYAQKKVISRILSKQYLRNLQNNTQMVLQHQGFFRSPLDLEIFQRFVPWLYSEVLTQLNQESTNRRFVQNLINESQNETLRTSQSFINGHTQKRNQAIKKREQEMQNKRIEKERRRQQRQERKRLQQEQKNQQNPPPAQNQP